MSATRLTIRPFERGRDEPLFRACIMELQETERAFDTRLPRGEAMVDAYSAVVMRRCAEWDGIVLVADAEDGVPLGMASVFGRVPSNEPDEPPGTFALLNDLVVLPAGRRQGVGRALLEAAQAFARECGAEVLRLEVMAANLPAVALYEFAGFRPRVLQMEKTLRRASP